MAGLTLVEYGESGLAEEVLAHIEAIVLAEQREQEKQTGTKTSRPRKRPEWKKKDSGRAN